MDDAGDMLRVATNVPDTDGKRGIGTFIPATNPDGTANPVVKTVLGGQTYRGRAFIVTDWYISAYEPIFNAQGKVIGMLCAAVKQQGNRLSAASSHLCLQQRAAQLCRCLLWQRQPGEQPPTGH